VVVLLSGCSSISYYSQLADGQWQLLRAREPVAEVIADPTRPQPLRDHLVQAQKARMFASEQLHLPDNQSYRLYADIGRPYVVWNVFATQEFSLQPENHCFPIAGCVAYRGYYSQGAARGEAALLRQQGMDVSIGGVEAYSTLGWFNDPIMSSMMHWGDERLATLIFHELAHQRFYVKDDTEFNESFATFVEQEGTRQWRAARGWHRSATRCCASATSSPAWSWIPANGWKPSTPSPCLPRRCARPKPRSSSVCAGLPAVARQPMGRRQTL
jgi:predicted aminopeptidase